MCPGRGLELAGGLWPPWRDWWWRQKPWAGLARSRWAQAGRAVVPSVDGRAGASAGPARLPCGRQAEWRCLLQETAVAGRAGLGAWEVEGRVCRPTGCRAGSGGGPQGFGWGPGANRPLRWALSPPPAIWATESSGREPPAGPAPSQQRSPPATSGKEAFDLS